MQTPVTGAPGSRAHRLPESPSRNGYLRAMTRGLRTTVFLLRIILPLSFAVSLAEWLGILERVGRPLAPVMGIFHLPGEAAVALVTGWLVGIYGTVAAMAFIHLSPAQVTVLSVLSLTAHNLVVECTVQHRTGTPWWLTLSARLVTAAVLGWVLALILMPHSTPAAVAAGPAPVHPGFGSFLLKWAGGAGLLSLKILFILLGLMLITEWMRTRDIYHRLTRPLSPFLRFLGLSRSVAFLWITAAVLGVAYGSGLLMEEAREPERYRPGDLRDLNISIGLLHSLIEDTALFVACGAGVFWITVPRFIGAATGVRVVRLLARRGRQSGAR